jgi:hypothetical protein
MASLWDKIETSPEAAAALVWKRRLGPAFDVAAAICLRETEQELKRIPCGSGCKCSHRVWPRKNRLIGICDCGEDCEDMELTTADVKVWKMDLTRLARAVAKALACTAVAKPFGSRRMVQVAALGNPPVPVMLTIQPDAESCQNAIAQLAVKLPKGFILLTPTKLTDAGAMDWAARTSVGLYDLETNFDITPSGTLQSAKTAMQLFAGHLPEQKAELEKTDILRVFAVLQKLKSKQPGSSAPLFDVFTVMILEGPISYRKACKKLDCSIGTLSTRIAELETEFKMPFKELLAYAKPMIEMEASVKGPRITKKKHGAPKDEPQEYADDANSENEDGYLPEELNNDD